MLECQTDNAPLDSLRAEARDIYYKLVALLGDDKAVAKKIAPLYKTDVFTVLRYVEAFSFRNKKNVKRFIETANQVINELDAYPIRANALLLCDKDESEIRIKERAKHLIALGIHAIVPQLMMSVEDAQFWDFVEQDAKYANFILAPKSMLEPHEPTNRIASSSIDKIANMYNIQVLDSTEEDAIKAHAIQISIKKLEKQNEIKKRREYE